mmetsp:Transcript_12753/g.27992  ORF Transcript_12753/g.27992 Transcript_12753/m.27992 type:complete len:601 (-) Transcript_12753:313-2115(-)
MTLSKDPASQRTVARPVANLGNTCYMNAVLQALAHAPELCLAMDCQSHRATCPIAAENKEKLRQRADSPSSSGSSSYDSKSRGTRKSRRSGRKTPPDHAQHGSSAIKFCALCELEEHISSSHDSALRDRPVAPENFVHGFIEHVAPWFKLGVQEDSHEFLRLLIDAMQKSCELARDIKPPRQVTCEEDAPGVDADDNKDIVFENTASSKPSEESSSAATDKEYPFSLFRGTVESTVTCGSCKCTSSTLDPIEDVGLEVTPPQAAATRNGTERSSRNASPLPAPHLYDVETAFRRFSQPETLDSGYKCEKCGKVGKATKQSKLASIPPILTVHLKRFRYGGGMGSGADVRRGSRSELGQLLAGNEFYGKSGSAKIEGHVKFNVLLDVKPYLTEELQEQTQTNKLCRLFAVIVHAGKNSHSGHYIAYVRHLTKNEWWRMDDGRVMPVSADEVTRAEAYMLFYRVVQHPVATDLERTYKATMEAKLADPQELAEASKTEMMNNIQNPGKRKRAMDKRSENGEEWARTKTKIPPHLVALIKSVEEKLSSDQTYLPEAVRRVLDELGEEGITALEDYDKAILKSKHVSGKWRSVASLLARVLATV